jgi:glycosyltransferase involved in cell wall biosynthesis
MSLGLVQLWPRLRRWIRRFGPFDVIHGYRGGAPGFLAALAARRAGAPLVLTLDGGELVGLRDIGYGLQLRWRDRAMLAYSVRTAKAVTVGSGYMRRLAEGRGMLVTELPFGVDLAAFPEAPVPAGPPRLLHVGHLNRVKDQETLLRAFRRVVDAGVPAWLDVVGFDARAGEVHELAARLGVAPRVTFHGLQRRERMPSFYGRSHLLVQSSRHEAAPVAVLEAAASGVAVVGTAVGYVADWAPKAAVATPVGDAAGLAEATLGLLRDEAHRRALAGRAQAWARAHDADWTAARLETLYAGHP